ncbi:response regulator transcription factor [Adlercreutzia caecimuris]|uniref:response regulator transcription factor n=1 Tax=Adlercreutzia caecimuris TaxID=671266 RepID=UPI00272A5400|nr:response regulator transcription factor [Adlercreutzia caecimuris]
MTDPMAEADRPIRVLVVDDQDLVRSGFKMILGTYPGIEIVGEAKTGEAAVAEAQRLKPDVVLMDIRMPEMNGIEATRAITGNPLLAKTRVLVLTTFDIDEYVFDALSAGASGFLLKDADPDDIAAAIRVVADGDALIQPSVMRRLVETFVAARPRAGWGSTEASDNRRAALASLTDREREILMLVARGLSNDDIAAELFISPATVKTHLARIMAKTDAHDRAQLVVFAYETGLVAPARA